MFYSYSINFNNKTRNFLASIPIVDGSSVISSIGDVRVDGVNNPYTEIDLFTSVPRIVPENTTRFRTIISFQPYSFLMLS